MSLVWLIAAALFAWTVVSFAFALWLGRLFSRPGAYRQEFRGGQDAA